VHKHRGGRVKLWIGDLPGPVEPALSLVELARPDRRAGNRAKRGREYRPIVPAMAFRQGHCLTSPFLCGVEVNER
jgi:hypothetical protein